MASQFDDNEAPTPLSPEADWALRTASNLDGVVFGPVDAIDELLGLGLVLRGEPCYERISALGASAAARTPDQVFLTEEGWAWRDENQYQ